MRWLKRIAIAIAVVIILLGLGAVALVTLVDPNHYKVPVAQAVKKNYNRTLRIDGDLQLTVFPRLGVEVQKLSLSEPGSTQIFAAVDSARVSVALLPLLSRRVVIDRVKVAGLKANVVRDQRGKYNFDDLLQSAKGNDLQSAPVPVEQATAGAVKSDGTSLQLDVVGVEFTNGELALRDYMTGASMRVEHLSATSGRVAPRSPFDFDVSAHVLGQNPRVDANVQSHGRVEFDPQAGTFSTKGFDLKATGVLPSVKATAFTAHGNLAYDEKRQAIDASALSMVFQGDVAGNVPLTDVDARLDVPLLSVGLNEGRLQVDKVSATAQGKAGDDPFEFNFSAPRLQVSEREASGDAMSARLRLSGSSAVDARFALEGVSGSAEKLNVAKVSVNGQLKQGARTIRLDAASPLEANLKQRVMALLNLAAQVQIDDAALPDKSMKIPLSGSIRADLDKERVTTRLNATIDDGKVLATAEVYRFDAPRVVFALTADTLDFDKLMPAAKAAPAKTGAADAPAPDRPVDLSALKDLNVQGSVKIGKLVARGLKAADVTAAVRVANGRADVTGLKASLYGGSLAGSLFADANTQRVGLAPTLSNVSIQPLLTDLTGKDTVSGRGNVALNLSASGKSVNALKRALDGTADMSLRNGAVKGINLAQSLRDLKSMLSAKTDADQDADETRQTDFSELTAQTVFANGVGTVRSLNLKSPLVRVTQGSPAKLDVGAGTLDLVVLVSVNAAAGQAGKDLALLRNLPIPVHLTGPFNAPGYHILWSKVGSELIGNTVKQQLEDTLGVGGDKSKDLEDSVKKGLKDLFGR